MKIFNGREAATSSAGKKSSCRAVPINRSKHTRASKPNGTAPTEWAATGSFSFTTAPEISSKSQRTKRIGRAIRRNWSARLCVVACTHNRAGLHSSAFLTRINCIYNQFPTRTNWLWPRIICFQPAFIILRPDLFAPTITNSNNKFTTWLSDLLQNS